MYNIINVYTDMYVYTIYIYTYITEWRIMERTWRYGDSDV